MVTVYSPEVSDVLYRGRSCGSGEVRLIARSHETYCGPIYHWAGSFWIIYGNRPVEVVHLGQRSWARGEWEERH